MTSEKYLHALLVVPLLTREVRPGPKDRHVLTETGVLLPVPDDWALLPPGDAALSRRIKKDGPTWTVIEKKGRKRFSHGIWAPFERIEALRAERAAEQEEPAYRKKLAAGRQRRVVEQESYAEDFRGAIYLYLDFAPRYRDQANDLADLITAHAVPVGSGTVARTRRIPIDQRAEAATIAWMRHQTTAYDSMTIPREKRRRREVRRMLAQRSKHLLAQYREGREFDFANCPLQKAIKLKGGSGAGPVAP